MGATETILRTKIPVFRTVIIITMYIVCYLSFPQYSLQHMAHEKIRQPKNKYCTIHKKHTSSSSSNKLKLGVWCTQDKEQSICLFDHMREQKHKRCALSACSLVQLSSDGEFKVTNLKKILFKIQQFTFGA